jgi:hypothetical protein
VKDSDVVTLRAQLKITCQRVFPDANASSALGGLDGFVVENIEWLTASSVSRLSAWYCAAISASER